MTLNEAEAVLALHLAFPFSPAKGHQLMLYFGSARAALTASASEIEGAMQDDGRTAQMLEKISPEREVMKAKQEAVANGVEIIDCAHVLYPTSLRALTDPPLVLYCQGALSSLSKPSLAIVGTRQASLYGKTIARELARQCSQAGITIISGLARGIDTLVHEGALETGETAAVIGSGLASIYPQENSPLAQRIAKKGVLCSEYPISTPPDRFQFPRRNRIIAALADALLLIEAPMQSGAMGTLEWGARLKKPCFALPGRVDMETFRGNHHLLREGKAKLVENAGEMISLLSPGKILQATKENVDAGLTPIERQLLLQFPQSEVSFDELAQKVELPIATLNALLVGLRIKHKIREYPGKLFKRVI